MALLVSRSDQRDFARVLVSDTSALKPGLTDPQWNSFIDDALYTYAMYADGDDSVFGFDTFSIASGANTAIVTFSEVPLNLEAVYLVTQSPDAKLAKKPLPYILSLQLYDTSSKNQPKLFAYDAQGSRTAWKLYLDALADKAYQAIAWYRREPIPYFDDTSTTPYGDGAARTIASMAAAKAAATVLRRPAEVIQGITASLPKGLEFAQTVALRSATHGGTLNVRQP